ncbi:hypothetical protein BURPSS13_C0083 [Burkholderia pseudomallei S13]|nr:hypothetical protein BURPSS13_C0083 [Burkholderia pseudomallei S13]
MTTMRVRCPRIATRQSRTRRALSSSRLAVGSSSSSSGAFASSPRAMHARWRCPPDSN